MDQSRCPIMTLPNELLSEIFVQCLRYQISPVNWNRPLPFSRDDYLPLPLLFTKVCRRWRSVAQLTPSLWAVLPHIGLRDISPGRNSDNLLRMYLAHSGHAPLSLGIYIQSSQRGAYIAALLSQHLHRVEVLTISYINGFQHSPFELLLFDLQGKFDLLTHFRLDCDSLKFHTSPYVNTFASAPRLTHVCIPSVSGSINLPWPQITHYHGRRGDLEGICQKLPLCQRLETLHIDDKSIQAVSGGMGSITKPIVLPCLRKIEIWDLDGALVHKLFDSLRVPLLEVVNIFALPSRSTLGALFGCLEQSSCVTVTSLELSECEISVGELLRLSRLAPGLQELDVQMISTDVVQALEATSTGDNIFPHLAMLTIRQFRVDIRMLFKICVSRCYPDDLGHVVRPVRQLVRCCICSLDQEVSRSLHNLFEDFEEDHVFQGIIERIDATLGRIAYLASDSEDEDYESDGAFGISSAESHATEIQIPLRMFEELERCLDFLESYQVTHALLLMRHNVEDIWEKFHEISEYHVAQTTPPAQLELQSNPSRLYLRAVAILDRWRPLIAEYTAGNMRWVDGKDGCDWYKLVHCPQSKTRVKASTTGVESGSHTLCNASLVPYGP